MTQINLLPWREELRERQKRQFFTGLASSAVAALLVVLAVLLFINGQIKHQTERNKLIEEAITVYDRQIKEIKDLKQRREALIARMNIIQQLQENRPQIVHFFDELVGLLPRGVHLDEVTRNGTQIMLVGQAKTNTDVSNLMRNIETNFWLSKPILEEIKEIKEKKTVKGKKIELKVNMFRLTILLMSKEERQKANGGD